MKVQPDRLVISEPAETDSIDCQHQAVGNGGLTCRAADRSGDKSTQRTDPEMCFSCPVGKVYRDVGCDAATPRVTFREYGNGNIQVDFDGMFCSIRKRDTNLDYCATCSLASAETTRATVTTTRGIFQSMELHTAFQNLEAGRKAMRDGDFERVITCSGALLESTLRVCHERLEAELPKKLTVTELWKSARVALSLNDLEAHSEGLKRALATLSGTVGNLAAARNALSDAHGKGDLSPTVTVAMAELCLNTASAVATFAARRLEELLNERSRSA